ncbi:sensor histidine kinase [Kitasatospora viridis]|uniref:Two-component system sensor histidine kinase DesK n=1 Tax=Kitasatospora viridis TaxID=281105 RepID=A0A561TVP0_9ACTN|nr:sensor histidine kinase [Kitasatospora viridis]TWF91177.1 two-component system sensor histidine kinase DesK [Kitasatospora viridis]
MTSFDGTGPRPVAERLRTWEWVYLGYLLFVPAQPYFSPDLAWWEWPLAITVCAATVLLYAVALLRGRSARQVWSSIVPMAVIGALATPFNGAASVLFIYAAAAAANTLPWQVARRWLAGLTVLDCATALLSQVPVPYRLLGFASAFVMIWVVGLLELRQRDRRRELENQRLRTTQVELLATLAERERIARDLHDLLGHSLTAVVMRAQLTKELVLADPQRARAESEEIERNAREALAAVRSTVTGWRRTSIRAELEVARRMLAVTGVTLRVSCEDEPPLAAAAEHELGLALREAVTNVARHARAATCHIGLDADEEGVRLVIADDGIGGAAPEGTGLTGLRERIAKLGGEVRRSGAAGTTLTITVPLEAAR